MNWGRAQRRDAAIPTHCFHNESYEALLSYLATPINPCGTIFETFYNTEYTLFSNKRCRLLDGQNVVPENSAGHNRPKTGKSLAWCEETRFLDPVYRVTSQ